MSKIIKQQQFFCFILQIIIFKNNPFFASSSPLRIKNNLIKFQHNNQPKTFSSLLPQCTDNFVLASEMSMKIQDEKKLNNNITTHLQLATVALGDTFCMMITANKSLEEIDESNEENEEGKVNEPKDKYKEGKGERRQTSSSESSFSILHSIEYIGLELHYAITGTYKFGIPVLSPQICSSNIGGISSSLCYRTHKGGQANTGCLTSGKSEICCQIDITPYKDWTFQAIRLKQPSTVVVLRYKIFERKTLKGTRWTNTFDEIVRIPLNKGSTKFELNSIGQESQIIDNSHHKIEISAVGSRPHRQMEPGMYFYQIMSNTELNQLREGVSLNGPSESSLEKLGWFRWDEKSNGWIIRKGLEKITQSQHIRVEDCKAQRYRTTFNLEQFVLKNSGSSSGEEIVNEELINYDLGNLINEENWLTIRTETKPSIVRHSSNLSNFTGTIVLDKDSNRYLNLTFFNARGTLIGQIFSSSDSLSVMESIFSIELGKLTSEKFQKIIATNVNSPKLVCFYPIGDNEGRICQRLELIHEPLKEKHFADQWQFSQTECIGCNERGVDSFLASLDPRQWLDGLNTPIELFTCTLELILCLVFLLSSILIFTKCIIPLCRCVHFVAKPLKKK
ncbi:hypothetical protein Mgra_00003513, partial [Meloidogyne graminicola]